MIDIYKSLFFISNFIFPFTFLAIICESFVYGERKMNVPQSTTSGSR